LLSCFSFLSSSVSLLWLQSHSLSWLPNRSDTTKNVYSFEHVWWRRQDVCS
jgi:hypothetical protein